MLLLCTRNGTVIEISIGSEFVKMQATPGEIGRDVERPGDMYERKENYQEIKKLNFYPRVVMNNHSTQRQSKLSTSTFNSASNEYVNQRLIRFAVHPQKPLMVSIGGDNEIFFWSTTNHQSLNSYTLSNKPTCINFSPDGRFMCIGYENGMLEIFSLTFNAAVVKDSKTPAAELDSAARTRTRRREFPEDALGSDMPVQKLIQTVSETHTNVLNLRFSDDSTLFAVSYLNRKEPEEGEEKITCFVTVYRIKPKGDGKRDKEDVLSKELVIDSQRFQQKLSSPMTGCYHMSFSTNKEYLTMFFQQFDEYLNRENDDKEKIYMIWHLKKNQPQENPDLDSISESANGKLNFPNHVNALYRYHERCLDPSEKGLKNTESTETKNLLISSMEFFKDYIFFGSVRGDLHLVQDSCLQVGANVQVESLKPDQYCLAKSYAGHSSTIEHIQVSHDGHKLFSSAIGDEVILEWSIQEGQPSWELDHTGYDMNMEDMFFREIEKRDEYRKIITEMLEARNQIIELQQNIDLDVEPEVSLKLEKIIGRKAFNRRNNVYYTANNHLLFSAASLLVMVDIPPEGMEITPDVKKMFFREKFLEVDRGDFDSTSPEISTFTLSPDRRYVCVGTIQKKAKLITWELTTNTFVKAWTLDNCCVVLNIKYSSDKKRLVCIALTEHYTQVVMLIDNNTGEILGSNDFSYSIPFRIKDVDFLPKSNDEFVTIGFQHLSKWKLQGGIITFDELPIENPKEMMKKAGILHIVQEREHRKHRTQQKNQDPILDENNEEIFPLEVTFLALIFLFDELMITAGDDGFVIYL